VGLRVELTMYICPNCRNELPLHTKYCKVCGQKNLYYDFTKPLFIIGCLIGLIAAAFAFYILPEIGLLLPIALFVAVVLITIVYLKYETKDELQERVIETIRERGAKLMSEQGSFDLTEIALACGWKIDDTAQSNNFERWVRDIADKERWSLVGNRYHPTAEKKIESEA